MVALNIVRARNFDRPTLGVVVVLFLVVWTGVSLWAYAGPDRRTALLAHRRPGVALAAMAVSALVKGGDLQATIPGFWVVAPLMAWAIHWGWRGGLVAAVLISSLDIAVRGEFTQVNYSNVFLLLIGGPIVGYLSDSLKAMAVERDAAQRQAAAAAERARLARAVHDGVLQVLAMMQRRGAENGGSGRTGTVGGSARGRAAIVDSAAGLRSRCHASGDSGSARRRSSNSSPCRLRKFTWPVPVRSVEVSDRAR